MLNRPVRFLAIRSAFDVDSDSAGKASLGEDIRNRGTSNGLRRRERSHHRRSGATSDGPTSPAGTPSPPALCSQQRDNCNVNSLDKSKAS